MFGAFTSLPFIAHGDWQADAYAFLFSLVNYYDRPVQLTLKHDPTMRACTNHPSYVLRFGSTYCKADSMIRIVERDITLALAHCSLLC